ncbi:hypothetical protein KUTeg_004462 [Tegillarca granosa]|uniref:Uncharacterized protein n=1 Tax=Tegillarca granosa TaxID=220873 RepID=A0ABQ9FQ10_TEGGR|nr:hypothetical protein KUTeg_004462 [Tegillarca granosa]
MIETFVINSVFIMSWAPPHDGRFHSQQQQKHCWQNLVDYLKCAKVKGKEAPACAFFYRSYRSLCASVFREKFEEQLENGTFLIGHKVAQMDISIESDE